MQTPNNNNNNNNMKKYGKLCVELCAELCKSKRFVAGQKGVKKVAAKN